MIMTLNKNRYYSLLKIPGCLFLALVVVAPIFSTLITSFKNYNFRRPDAQYWVGLKNYIDIINDNLFWESIWHTIIYVFFAIGFECVIGMLIALLFFNMKKENSISMSFLILPSVISPVVVGLIFRFTLNSEFGIFTYLLNSIGLLKDITLLGSPSTALGTIIFADIWQWSPFLALMFVSGLISLPAEPFEAAKVDGASAGYTFFKITLPLLKPVVRVSLMIRIADVIKEFDKIFVMTEGGPGSSSETLNYLTYRVNFRNFTMGKGAAYVIIVLIFILFFSIVVIRTIKSEEI